MKNLLETIKVATVFLNQNLLLRGFTDRTKAILNLTNDDLGLPIKHDVIGIDYLLIAEDVQQVLHSQVEMNRLLENEDNTYAIYITPNFTQENTIDGVVISFFEISELKLSKIREKFYTDILEFIATGTALPEILKAIVLKVEQEHPHMICSILLLDDDGKRLLTGAAPSLPKFYNDAIHGVKIGQNVGSCGTAAFMNERVIVEDIQNHAYWSLYKGLAQQAGLASCWSEPIRSSSGKILGTFAIYHSTPRYPSASNIFLIEEMAHLVSIAIERKQDAEKVRQAEQANKEKSQFLANMSHDLRTPMHAILSFADLSLKHTIDPKIKPYLENIKISGIRLTALLNDLLDLSKLESGKMDVHFVQHDMDQLVRECLVEVSSLLSDKDIKLSLEIDQSMSGMFDRKLMGQVIINLLSNAIKFSPDGGSLDIGCHYSMDLIDRIEQKVILFTIKDQGMGIPENELKTIFDKFVQSSQPSAYTGGTGLGLAICRKIVEMHSGHIWAENTADSASGALFTLVIPVMQKSSS